ILGLADAEIARRLVAHKEDLVRGGAGEKDKIQGKIKKKKKKPQVAATFFRKDTFRKHRESQLISRWLDERWRVGRAFLLLERGLWFVWGLDDPCEAGLKAHGSHRFTRVGRGNRVDSSAQKLRGVGCFDFIA